MNRHAVFHEAKSRWAYAADSGTLHIRLRTARDDVLRVVLCAADPFNWFPDDGGSYSFDKESVFIVEMERELCDGLFDYWFCELRNPPTYRLRYCFNLESDAEALRFGACGFTEVVEPDYGNMIGWFNYPFINEEDVFQPPKWVEDTVWYQIFGDRFARSEEGARSKKAVPDWGGEVEVLHATHFGGNLKGVMEKLPYLADMGFTGIYFTPIFKALTVHRYDTNDYFKIDPQFGTNEEFSALVQRAHDFGIRVILDGVFNHCGFSHPFFQDVVKKGRKSPYFTYFHILKEPVINFPLSDGKPPPRLNKNQMLNLPYRTFSYTPHMPKWNTADPGARAYLIKAARYWVEEHDIDGWRLDVSNEVSHDFWRELCREVRSVKRDAFLLGENWDDAYPWLGGGQFDSTMNYTLLTAVNNYANGKSDAAQFASAMTCGVFAAYPKPAQKALFNLIESHDTDRLLTIYGGNAASVKLGYALLFAMSGSPCVYYGSEIGMDGILHGGENRRCLPWNEPVPSERDFRPFLKKLMRLRKKHPAFRSTDITFNNYSESLLTFTKEAESEALVVIANNGPTEQKASLPNGTYIDVMDYAVVKNGIFFIPPRGFRFLLRK